jgi:hypothetical protein
MATPTKTLTLKFELLSAATFGRGDGLPGIIDREVEHDQYGFPFLRGRSLRGLLAEEMRGLLYALGLEDDERWKRSRNRLLGTDGRMTDESGILHVGDASLPEMLRLLLAESIDEKKGDITRSNVLESMTAIRRQTAMTAFGVPEPASLRAMRVILRGTIFESRLTFDAEPEPLDKALLAATALAWRRAGIGRNRGRGRLRAWLENDDWMLGQFEHFQKEVAR